MGTVIRLNLLFILLMPLASPNAAPRIDKPNFVLLVADDLGREWLTCYGGQEIKTPHIDRLANGGARFETCYASSHGSVSLNILLTGRYPFRNGWMWENDVPKWGPPSLQAEKETTFVKLLESAGYATCFSGSWTLNDLNQDKEALRRHGYGEQVSEGGVVQFMKENRERPFLAHVEIATPKGDAKATVQRIDDLVGTFVETLEVLKIDRQTIIVFTSLNGSDGTTAQAWGRQVKGGKGKMTDTGINVPLIVSGSFRVRRGQVIRDLVDFSDLYPTLLKLAGIRRMAGKVVDGRAFDRQLAGQPGNPREWIFSQYGSYRVIRNGQYKLYSNGRFYNLLDDPLEERNLARANNSEAQAEMERLAVLLKEMPDDKPLDFPYARRLMIRRR